MIQLSVKRCTALISSPSRLTMKFSTWPPTSRDIHLHGGAEGQPSTGSVGETNITVPIADTGAPGTATSIVPRA